MGYRLLFLLLFFLGLRSMAYAAEVPDPATLGTKLEFSKTDFPEVREYAHKHLLAVRATTKDSLFFGEGTEFDQGAGSPAMPQEDATIWLAQHDFNRDGTPDYMALFDDAGTGCEKKGCIVYIWLGDKKKPGKLNEHFLFFFGAPYLTSVYVTQDYHNGLADVLFWFTKQCKMLVRLRYGGDGTYYNYLRDEKLRITEKWHTICHLDIDTLKFTE